MLLHAQPTKQFVQVEEVAAFLASDAAASITGAIIPIDGGWTAQQAVPHDHPQQRKGCTMATKTAKRRKISGNGAVQTTRRPALPGQVVLVLQGGGALGAYQVGVYEALHEGGVEPDWVIGTSIGAIKAALITGNVPENRLPRLREFWSRVEQGSGHDLLRFFTGLSNAQTNLTTVLQGIPAFFTPNLPAWLSSHAKLGVEQAAYYTTAPLRKTLSDLVDLEHIAAQHTRLTVGAVNVRNGEMRYFASRDETVHLDHVLAMGKPGRPHRRCRDS